VADAQGVAITNAAVGIARAGVFKGRSQVDPSDLLAFGHSAADGSFVLQIPLAAGIYDLKVARRGYRPLISTITIDGSTHDFQVTLVEAIR
jgi:hypothetical protein